MEQFISQWKISLHGALTKYSVLLHYITNKGFSKPQEFWISSQTFDYHSFRKTFAEIAWGVFLRFRKCPLCTVTIGEKFVQAVWNCIKQLSSPWSQQEKDHVWNQSWIRAASETDGLTQSPILCTHSTDKHWSWPWVLWIISKKVNILLFTPGEQP